MTYKIRPDLDRYLSIYAAAKGISKESAVIPSRGYTIKEWSEILGLATQTFAKWEAHHDFEHGDPFPQCIGVEPSPDEPKRMGPRSAKRISVSSMRNFLETKCVAKIERSWSND